MEPAKPKLRDQLHAAMRARFYSRRTEKTYQPLIARDVTAEYGLPVSRLS